jgi:outer membrane protein assembly factor BamB
VEFGNTLFLVVGDVIYGFDVPSGKLTEGYDPKFALGTPPVVYDDSLILAGSKGDLARVNLADGSRPWQKSIMGAIFYPPVVSAGRLFAAGYRDQLISLDLEKGDKGKAPWWGWTPPAPSWLSSGLATLGDSIYVGDQRGFLYRLKAESGELTAKETLESPIVGEPSVVNGRLMVFTERPSMVCMGAEGAGMQQLWRYEGARKLLSVGKKVAYVLNDGPSVAAVRLEDGKELWRRALPKDCRVAGDPQRPAFYVANSAGSIVAFAELD